MHYSISEWEALPYWHKAAYLKGLLWEYRKAEDQQEQPPSGVSEEGLAALEARGVRVIRKG